MKYIIFFATLLLTVASIAGHGVRNGGVTVRCPQSGKSFSLDYFLAKGSFTQDTKIVKFRFMNQSLNRIETLLKEKVPELASSFVEFNYYTSNVINPNAPYFWKVSSNPLPELDDQDVTSAFDICPEAFNTVPFTATQAVIRHDLSTSTKFQVTFEYDSQAIKDLDATQKSFLFVHEWLWNISKDIEQNRKINYFLHSSLLEELSAPEVKQQLKRYGIR